MQLLAREGERGPVAIERPVRVAEGPRVVELLHVRFAGDVPSTSAANNPSATTHEHRAITTCSASSSTTSVESSVEPSAVRIFPLIRK